MPEPVELKFGLEFFEDPGEFLDAASTYLERDAVLNNLVASVANNTKDEIAKGIPQDTSYPMWWLIVRDSAGEVAGVGMRAGALHRHPLFLLPMPDAAAVALARTLYERQEEATGVNGSLPAASLCAEELARLLGGTMSVAVHTRLFELGDLVDPRRPAGRLRLAEEADVDLALRWFDIFRRDVDRQGGREPELTAQPTDRDAMLRRIAAGRVWFWVDEDDQRVHLTGATSPVLGVARIGPVYTPREHRGRGYASAAVAEVSRLFRDRGARVCLFTDQANPTSNKIYEELGYRAIADMANLVVVP